MPLSKARMKERKRRDRAIVKPASNLNPVKIVKPGEDKLSALRGLMQSIETGDYAKPLEPNAEVIPLYDPTKHKAGARVKLPSGQITIVYEVDADGQRIW